MKQKILYIVVGVVLAIQLIRPDFSDPVSTPTMDFLALHHQDDSVVKYIKSSCYDCHSNHLEKPWYASVAPISWVVKNHINEGRRELNFSNWGNYSLKRKKHKLHECIEMLENDEMAPGYYKWTHPEARLNDRQRKSLAASFETVMQQLTDTSGK